MADKREVTPIMKCNIFLNKKKKLQKINPIENKLFNKSEEFLRGEGG